MSDWTHEKHFLARQASVEVIAHPGGDVCERAADYLGDALDEIERLRSIAGDPDAIERAAKAVCDAPSNGNGVGYWQYRTNETVRDWYRDDARAALRAALSPEDGEKA